MSASEIAANQQAASYDAVVLVSFGGPDHADDVLPFLENVTRGRNIPRDRLLQVAEHYYHFGGASPINAQNQALIAAMVTELDRAGIDLPVYWGNRNWHPLLADTLRQMAEDGVQRALAFVTSSHSSYSGCRQYRENIEQAREQVGPTAPVIDKLRVFYNHPGFIDPMIERVADALEQIPPERREQASLLFTAHSVPTAMSDNCNYVKQLEESCRLVSAGVGRSDARLVYQSRSGPPQQPWLEPDICDVLEQLSTERQIQDAVVVPIGFISDHMEVVFDLDTEARELCEKLGVNLVRAGTVGTHPRFVQMIRELIEERLTDNPQRLAVGQFGPNHDVCPLDCCLYTPRRPGSPTNAPTGE